MKLFTPLTLLTILVAHAAQAAPKPVRPKPVRPKATVRKTVPPKATAPKTAPAKVVAAEPVVAKPVSPAERRWTPQFVTYLGGSGSDSASTIVVDGAGNFYVAGSSNSPTFPGAQRPSGIKQSDAYVCKFSPSYQLLWTRFIGGSGTDQAMGIAIDKKGDVYVVGQSENGDIPILNAPEIPYGQRCAFVARYSSEGEIKMSLMLGSSNWAIGEKIVVDEAGNIWLAGIMRGQFPTKDAKLTGAGKNDVWLSKMTPSGQLLFSTLLGGSEDESLDALILAPNGGVALAGTTASANFPIVNATQTAFGGASSSINTGDVKGDAWVSVLDAEGKTRWATFFGGRSDDSGNALAFAPNGDLWLVGSSISRDLALKKVLPEGDNVGGPFLARFTGDGSQLLQSTFVPRAPGNARLLSVGVNGDLWIGSDAVYFTGSQFTHLDADATKVVETIPWPTDNIRGLAMSATGALYMTGSANARLPVRRALMAPAGDGYKAFIAVLQLQSPPAPDAKPASISVDAPSKGLSASGTTSVGDDGEVQVMLYRSADSTYWTGTEWKNVPNWLSARVTGTRWKLENLPQGTNLPAGDYYLYAAAVTGEQFENFLGMEYDGSGRAKTSRKVVITP